MKSNDDIVTTRHVSFRWDGKQLILITNQSQIYVTPDKVLDLLQYLYSYHDQIIEQAHDLPDWACDPSTEKTPRSPYQMPRLQPSDDEETRN